MTLTLNRQLMIYYAKTNKLTIAFLEKGAMAKPVVLLLHGWPDDATTWEGVMPEIVAAGFRAIAPWLRGFGNTSFNEDDTLRTGNSGILAMDMIEFMDRLGIKKFNVIGHDWGSNIAEALAVGWPERISRMALLSSAPRLGGMLTPSFKQAQLDWYHWFMATKRGQEAVREDPIGFAHLMWVNWAPPGWFEEKTFQAVAASWNNPDFVNVTLHSYQARWQEAEPDPESAELEEQVKTTQTLSLPTLYIQGEADGVNPPYVSENVQQKFTGWFHRVVMPGVGHFPSREAAESLSSYLTEFLRGTNI